MHHVTVNPVVIVYLNDFIQERNDSYCSLHTAGLSVACYVPLAAKAASVIWYLLVPHNHQTHYTAMLLLYNQMHKNCQIRGYCKTGLFEFVVIMLPLFSLMH